MNLNKRKAQVVMFVSVMLVIDTVDLPLLIDETLDGTCDV